MKAKFFYVLFFCLIIFPGCSIKETVKNTSDQQMLRERGTVYWGYICSQQFDKAYEFEYPLYRKTVSLVNYIRRFRPNITWKKAEIEKITVEDDAAIMTVKVDTEMEFRVPKTPKRIEIAPQVTQEEKWVKVDGTWYHVPQSFAEAK